MESVHRNPSVGRGHPGSESAMHSLVHSEDTGGGDRSRQRDAIVRHISYLRRYARALSGSQQAGDQYVRLCLETLVEEPERLDAGPFLRLQLYRLFHQTWKGVADGISPHGLPFDIATDGFQSRLTALPPRHRQVLLLTAVEGFSVEETAAILEIAPEKAENELVAARIELNDQAATSVLIIEDEPIIALDLSGIVGDMGHDVVGIAATRDEAIALAAGNRPGIILADIQLGDGSSGVDAVSEIQRSQYVPVVFVTAYPERLLTGVRQEPAYLVTKPFEPDVLRVTIYQALLSGDTPPIPRSWS